MVIIAKPRYCQFCGKVLTDYDHEDTCAECN